MCVCMCVCVCVCERERERERERLSFFFFFFFSLLGGAFLFSNFPSISIYMNCALCSLCFYFENEQTLSVHHGLTSLSVMLGLSIVCLNTKYSAKFVVR